ncbi:HAD-like domain-containing protein [Microdochium trichocladiopsis]|uniref:HAD-like domain-containing protein n=1 Tax=Microdochium trichocladiopsis TaxID=1682393 RepID=A0A9P9BU12_9PEZI|nr:HAD-like domain-containing protein [Microdochium trichocladiopsis]KAH7037602.1 HAD-like domain-containing protein [Microdochium trichocladiopsis]
MKTHPEHTATGPCVEHTDHPTGTALKHEVQTGFILAQPLRYKTLVLDLGDVLAFYSGKGLDLPISASLIGRILKSTSWGELECGRVAREECLARLSRDFDVEPSGIEETLRLLAGTLTYNTELVEMVRYLKKASGGDLRVYLATNITAQDYEILRPAVEAWEIFDDIFPSFQLGARKPDGSYYRHLLDQGNIEPESTLLVDDKPDNIVAARVFGMHGIQYLNNDKTIASVKRAFGDTVARAEAWLRANAKTMWSETNIGVVLREVFAQLLILENLGERSLVTLPEDTDRRWNFFDGQPALTTAVYPDDLDTNALAFRNADGISEATKNTVMDEMLTYMDEDGLFNTYFDRNRPRPDIHVTANVMWTFYSHNRGHQVQRSLSYMCAVARTRAYESATRYYLHPDWFFYYLSGLCAQHSDLGHPELGELRGLLVERLAERFGSVESSDPWSLAMRLVAADRLGFDMRGAGARKDLDRLRAAQQADGSWSEQPWIYRYGSGVLIGSVGTITALAVRALKAAEGNRL